MEVKDILEIIDRMEESAFDDIRIVHGDTKLWLRKNIQESPCGTGPAGYAGPAEPAHTRYPGGTGSGESGDPAQEKSATSHVEAHTSADGDKATEIITSPIVGTFYRAPAPDSPPFVEEGSVVRKGQTLCILEAMKIMNELESEKECTILEILAENGTLVEYGTPLFRVTSAGQA